MQRALEIVRESAPVLGAFMIGVALGLYLLGIQLPACETLGGHLVGPTCGALEWGDRWATRAGVGGGVAFGVAFAAEAMDGDHA